MTPYDLAAALAESAARFADTLDDGPQWPRWHYSAHARALLDLLANDHTLDDPKTAAAIGRAIAAPWFSIGNEYRRGGEFACHTVTAAPGTWTAPGEQPGGLRTFLQTARLDVLMLAAEVWRLRTALDQHEDNPADDWGCLRCGAAYYGPVPDDGLCRECRQHAPA